MMMSLKVFGLLKVANSTLDLHLKKPSLIDNDAWGFPDTNF